MTHGCYELHAFIASGLLSVVLAPERLGLIKTVVATIFAIPLIVLLLIALITTLRSFKGDVKARRSDCGDAEMAGTKAGAKIEKKRAKELAKTAKKVRRD